MNCTHNFGKCCFRDHGGKICPPCKNCDLYDPSKDVPIAQIVRIAPQTPVQAVPPEKWPIGVRLIAEARKPEDKGVGDTIHRLIPKADELIAWMKRIGIDCGCADRRAALNQRFPY